MLDYGSEDIDGMDDDDDEEQGQNPPFTGRWPATSSYDVYMVDTPKKLMTKTKKIQLRINLLRHSPSVGALNAVLSLVAQKMATLAPEKIVLWATPKTMKTLLEQHPNKRNKTTGKLTLINRPCPMTRMMIVIVQSLRMRRASAARISSCLRHPSSRSASSAS